MISRKHLRAFYLKYKAIKYLLMQKYLRLFSSAKNADIVASFIKKLAYIVLKKPHAVLETQFLILNRNRARRHKLSIFFGFMFQNARNRHYYWILLSTHSDCNRMKKVDECVLKGFKGINECWRKDVIVKVDKTKIVMQTYKIYHRLQWVWLLVNIERREGKAFFAVELEKRDYQTIKAIFLKIIPNKLILYTDECKKYAKMLCNFLFEA